MRGLRRGAALAAAGTLLAAGLMLGLFAAGQAGARPLESLPASSQAAGWGHPAAEGQIDINTADAQALTALPGIGPARAAAIVAYREEHGPFRYPEELLQVEGIGTGILADILDKITVGGG
ncbi:MAG: ComEA family DNA-binding protein [Candidatus Enterenecus sp.]